MQDDGGIVVLYPFICEACACLFMASLLHDGPTVVWCHFQFCFPNESAFATSVCSQWVAVIMNGADDDAPRRRSVNKREKPEPLACGVQASAFVTA